MSNYLTSPRLNPQLQRKKTPWFCIRRWFLDGSDRNLLQWRSLPAAHAEPGGPCNVCRVLQERASSVDAQRAGTERGRPMLWRRAARCHQRSRSVASALVSGSHSLSGASDCERNTDNIQCRPSNLFIFVTCRSPRQVKRLPAGLTWAEY